MATADDLYEYINQLCREEEYEPEEGVWMFRSGGSCCRCVDSAVKVVEKFRGRVVGYKCSRNPSSLIGLNICEGHDFAIVEERFIVDYWAFRIACVIDRPVLDLTTRQDCQIARQIYGDNNTWEEVTSEHQH
jgi:hypothetical protein